MEWKNRKTRWYEAVSSAFNFPFFKEVLQNSFVLTLSNPKIEEVWQNCFVFDVVNLKIEEVLQNCFAFDVVKCKN